MNRFKVKENKRLKEKYYYTQLDSGFKITVIPKDYPTAFAMVSCDFGSADIEYEKNQQIYKFPAGTAHFLEHKMFENEDGSDAFLEFDRFGGNANAFTSFENTGYYFSCTDNFFENLNVLLKAVSSVHFSDESVEKEKKIIAQEITMYEDSPSTNVAKNLSRALYFSHPTIHAVSGTVESISEITKETLFRAYDDFYVPANMSLCVCGNIDALTVLEIANKYFGTKKGTRPKTMFPDEPKTVNKKVFTENSIVASPLYCIGIKCNPFEENDLASHRFATALRLAISLIFGRASDFYCQNYAKGLLNERFYAGYTQSKNCAHIVISGSGSDYNTVMQEAIKAIEDKKRNFFTNEEIVREKRAAYAESLTLFDSGEDIVASMAACAHLSYDDFDGIDALCDITPEEIKEALCSVNTENCAISIIQKGTD
ncbi:MAG: insulinase family protein [Clostridia bacterium]|nr:insulinase family protein [Clostridia bacterium]